MKSFKRCADLLPVTPAPAPTLRQKKLQDKLTWHLKRQCTTDTALARQKTAEEIQYIRQKLAQLAAEQQQKEQSRAASYSAPSSSKKQAKTKANDIAQPSGSKKRKGEDGSPSSVERIDMEVSDIPLGPNSTPGATKKKKRVHKKTQAQTSPVIEPEGEAVGSIDDPIDDPVDDPAAPLFAGGPPITMEELEIVDEFASNLESLARAILVSKEKAKAAASPPGGETAPPASAAGLDQDQKAGPPLAAGPEEADLADNDEFIEE